MNFFKTAWQEAMNDMKAFFASPKDFWAQAGVGLKAFVISDVLSSLSLVLLPIGIVLSHLEIFPLGFNFMSVSVLLMIIGFIGGVAEVLRGGKSYGLFAILFWGAMLVVPVGIFVQGSGLPLIHDITTDLKNPPQFEAVMPLRPANANDFARAERGLKTAQRKHYKGVRPLRLRGKKYHPGRVFDTALAMARARGWEIVAFDPKAGRIEATDKSLFMGFRDDVVVLIRYSAARGKKKAVVGVDMRSVSRFGRSDFGKNAARIESFLNELKAKSRQQKKKSERG